MSIRHTSFITFFRLRLRLLDHYWAAGENMCASTFLVFYFVLNCASSLSSFAAQTTPAASINKTFGLKIIEFFLGSVISTHTRHLYIFHNTSNLSPKILLPWNYPSFREWRSWVLTIYMGKPKILVGKWNGQFAPFRLKTFRKCGLWFEAMQFFYSFKSVQLILIYFVAGSSPTTSSFIVLCLCTRFPLGWFL